MLSEDRADWIEYDKRKFRQILGRLTRVITGTLDPRLARCPDDESAQLSTPSASNDSDTGITG